MACRTLAARERRQCRGARYDRRGQRGRGRLARAAGTPGFRAFKAMLPRWRQATCLTFRHAFPSREPGAPRFTASTGKLLSRSGAAVGAGGVARRRAAAGVPPEVRAAAAETVQAAAALHLSTSFKNRIPGEQFVDIVDESGPGPAARAMRLTGARGQPGVRCVVIRRSTGQLGLHGRKASKSSHPGLSPGAAARQWLLASVPR
mmetsp:Transcript_24338/g.91919  ORF Transcript_24338/g.91919 Transcript_24338/m.91919 type:complete len:204 (+) Transcript_24338:1291-1902(+)